MKKYINFAENSSGKVGKFDTTVDGNTLIETFDLDIIQDSEYGNGFGGTSRHATMTQLTTAAYANDKKSQLIQQNGATLPYLSTVTYEQYARITDPITGNIYKSLQPMNIGNPLNDVAWWELESSPVVKTLTLFSVNSGKITSGVADFLSIANNKQINVLAGSGNPDLVMSYASAETVEETTNQIIDITQNGSYYLTRDSTGYTPIPFSLSLIGNIINGQNKIYNPSNLLTQGTATRTNGSPTLSVVAGIDWTHIAAGNLLSGLGMAISLAATVATTNTSNILTGVILAGAEWAKLKKGQRITGTGIPANNFITAFDENAQTITIQIAATATNPSIAATISITPKITAFNEGAATITLDTNAISTGAAGAIQIYEEADLPLFKIGMPITGTGIPLASTITAIDIPNKTITINNNSTANTDLLAITTTQTGIYEQNIIPATPIDGELFVQKNPLEIQKYISSAWTDFDFVKLGEIAKASGVIGTPVSYAFNGMYESAITAVATGVNVYQFNHNINSRFVEVVCAWLSSSNTMSNAIEVYWNPDSDGTRANGMAKQIANNNRLNILSENVSFTAAYNTNLPNITSGFVKLILRRSF